MPNVFLNPIQKKCILKFFLTAFENEAHWALDSYNDICILKDNFSNWTRVHKFNSGVLGLCHGAQSFTVARILAGFNWTVSEVKRNCSAMNWMDIYCNGGGTCTVLICPYNLQHFKVWIKITGDGTQSKTIVNANWMLTYHYYKRHLHKSNCTLGQWFPTLVLGTPCPARTVLIQINGR